jgi:UDP:flavonoid glycosyltransferase YjiC (YdhE family)
VITHAGLNTVLESLSEGVPIVALPQGNDQPEVAARVEARGAGIVIPRSKLNVSRLRHAVSRVLEETSYRANAQELRRKMQRVDGPAMAAHLFEQSLELAEPKSATEYAS